MKKKILRGKVFFFKATFTFNKITTKCKKRLKEEYVAVRWKRNYWFEDLLLLSLHVFNVIILYLGVFVVNCLDVTSDIIPVMRDELTVRARESLQLLMNGGDVPFDVIAGVTGARRKKYR